MAKRIATVFFVQWLLLLVISLLNPRGLYPVGPYAYFLVCIFLTMLIAGLTSISIRTTKNIDMDLCGEEIKESVDYLATSKYMIIAVILADVFLGVLYVQFQTLLETMTAMEYRNNGGLQVLFEGNSILGVTYTFFIAPLSFFSTFFLCYLLLYNNKAIIPILLYAANIVLHAYTQGQRSGFIDVFVFFAFLLYCCTFLYGKIGRKQKRKLILRNLSIIAVVGIVALGAISFMTNQRVNNNNELSIASIQEGQDSTSDQLITYMVGPLRALDYGLNNNYVDRMGGYTYGRSTLGFVDSFLQFIGRNIGINFKTANGRVYDVLQNKWIKIPSDFNYAYTAVFNFYVDFDIIGVFLFPFLLGIIIRKLIDILWIRRNAGVLLSISYLVFVVCTCYFTWRMIELSAMFIIIWLVVINWVVKKRKLLLKKYS